MGRIGFFLGAGAEAAFGLPQGADFTRQTILAKRTRLYEALNAFYRERPCPEYVGEYSRDFLFAVNSVTFRRIVEEAAERCQAETWKDQGQKDRVDEETLAVLAAWSRFNESDDAAKKQKYEDRFREEVAQVYQAIVRDYDEGEEKEYQKHGPYSALQKYFAYYGSVEKDFATIIDPQKSPKRFWRLINYFWGAFFAILLPMLDRSARYRDRVAYRDHPYRYVLQHLEEVLADVYGPDFCNDYRMTDDGNEPPLNYYQLLRENLGLEVDQVITTNYTPLARQIWSETGAETDRIAYLAGELGTFEFPQQLTIRPLLGCGSRRSDFLFPYLLTQAPVKPIIEPGQIRQYARAICFLKETEVLVVLGYGINEEDNHIRALLREYVMNPDKKLVYLHYGKQGKEDEAVIKAETCGKLKVSPDKGTIRGENLEKSQAGFLQQIRRVCSDL